MNEMIEMIGFFAAALGVLSFMPQVIKIWRSKSAEAISSTMYIIYIISVALWIIYGMLIKSPPIVIANLLIFLLAVSILGMKFLWK